MQTFTTALRVASRHWGYALIYVVSMSLLGLFVTLGYTGDGSGLNDHYTRVAVIDRDGSALSRGLGAHLASFSLGADDTRGELVPVEDSPTALADVAAQDLCAYVLIVPEDYGARFMDAAKAGADAPELQTVTSYASGDGEIMNLRCMQYLQAAYGFAGTVAQGDQAKAVRLANEAIAGQAEVLTIPSEVEAISPRLVGFFGWCSYPVFCAATVIIATLMASLNQADVRRRTLASPLAAGSRMAQVFFACLAISLVSCAFIVVTGVVGDGVGVLATSGPQVALMCLAMMAYALVAGSFGFLVGQLGASEMAANAIGNVGGMVLSFLGGAWMPFELLGDSVRAVARLCPSYWCGVAVNAARDMAAISWAEALPSLQATGVVALFAVALTAAAFAVGGTRSRAA